MPDQIQTPSNIRIHYPVVNGTQLVISEGYAAQLRAEGKNMSGYVVSEAIPNAAIIAEIRPDDRPVRFTNRAARRRSDR